MSFIYDLIKYCVNAITVAVTSSMNQDTTGDII